MIYADMIDRVIVPAIKRLYPWGNVVWQDYITREKFPDLKNSEKFQPNDPEALQSDTSRPTENFLAVIKKDLDEKVSRM